MERLSGLDASFLYIESVSQPQHVCSVLEVDTSSVPGGYSFEGLRDELAVRIAAIPEFRVKLADSQLNLDYPVWVDDDAFDVDRHLFRISLPSPGGRRELAEICGHIATEQLDRGKPLWEMWVIEGIADTDPHAGGVLAVMTKVHHAAVDGVTGANLLSQLCSLEPDVPPPEPVEGPGNAGALEIAAGGLVRFVFRPLQLVNVIPATAATVVKTLRRARSGMTMAAPFAAPATRFNTTLTAHRNVAFAQLDIDDIKKVKDRFNVTVNDVVMALCAAVLRWFLSDHAELPDKSLVAMVPVSVHDKCDRPGHNSCRECSANSRRTSVTLRNDYERSPGPTPLPRITARSSIPRCCRIGRNSPRVRCSVPCSGLSPICRSSGTRCII